MIKITGYIPNYTGVEFKNETLEITKYGKISFITGNTISKIVSIDSFTMKDLDVFITEEKLPVQVKHLAKMNFIAEEFKFGITSIE